MLLPQLNKAKLKAAALGVVASVSGIVLSLPAYADDFESWSKNGSTKVGNGFEYWLGVVCLVFAATSILWGIITLRTLLKGENSRHGWGSVIGSIAAGAFAFGFSYHAGVITNTFSTNGIETRTPGSQMQFDN